MSGTPLSAGPPRAVLFGEAAAAAALIAWRVALRPPQTLWRDIVLIASVTWMLDVAFRGRRSRPWAIAAGAVYLFAAYALWHAPYLVSHLRLVL